MGFEYQREPGKKYLKVTYNDDRINSIFKTKENLKIDVDLELDDLKKLKSEIESEYELTCKKRDKIVDWDSDEYAELEDECWDLSQKISSLDDLIDYFEELSERL